MPFRSAEAFLGLKQIQLADQKAFHAKNRSEDISYLKLNFVFESAKQKNS
jgi:hypothetical protein